MGREQNREVERRDRRDRRKGEAARDCDPALPGGDGVGRQNLAANARRFFSGIAKHENGSLELGARLGDRLAGLQRQRTGQLALRRFQAVGDFAQRGRALVCRKLAAGTRCRDVRVERCPDVLRTRKRNDTDFTAIVRGADDRGLPLLLLLTRRHGPSLSITAAAMAASCTPTGHQSLNKRRNPRSVSASAS